jgi:protein gp37
MVNGKPAWTGKITFVESALDLPLRWQKPRMIFVNSVSDLFHDNVPFEYVDRVFEVMKKANRHIFQVLTKRPQRMIEYLKSRDFGITRSQKEYNHVWLGISIPDQEALEKERKALNSMGRIWFNIFLSCEPLLSPLNFKGHDLESISWIIAGGESGRNARPMHPEWIRQLKNACAENEIPFFFKQFGEYLPLPQWDKEKLGTDFNYPSQVVWFGKDPVLAYKVGKHKSGSLLDGIEYKEFPASMVSWLRG